MVDGLPEFEIRAVSPETGPPRTVARVPRSPARSGRSILAAVAEGDADIVLLDGLLTIGRD